MTNNYDVPLFEKLPSGRLIQVPQAEADALRQTRRYNRRVIQADILLTEEEEQNEKHLVEQKWVKDATRREEEKLLKSMLAKPRVAPTE